MKKFNEQKVSSIDTRTIAISEGSKQFLESLSLCNDLKKYAEPIKMIKNTGKSTSISLIYKSMTKII